MKTERKAVQTRRDGKVNIHVTVGGEGEDQKKTFKVAVNDVRKMARRMRKMRLADVSYKIETSGS